MRKLAFVTLAVLAACSEEKTPGPAASAAADKMLPGQWETTTEITSMTMADKTMPAMKSGTKVTASNCVTAADLDKPEAAMFAGSKGSCKYDNYYMANGRLNASMTCQQPGRQGNVISNVEGRYSGTTFDATVDSATYTGGVDFKMRAKVTGRRIADACVPETEAEPKAG